jgi:hypothetical protein
MTRPHPLLIAVLLAAALVAATAPGWARAATISSQAELRPPKRFPVAMAGGYQQGKRIPRGHVLLRRSVAVATDERVTVRFRCPGRRTIRTIGLNDPGDVGIQLPRSQRHYDRHRRVRLIAYASPNLDPGEVARGRVYVLCGPKR